MVLKLRANTTLTIERALIFDSLVAHVDDVLFNFITVSQVEALEYDATLLDPSFLRKKLKEIKKMQSLINIRVMDSRMSLWVIQMHYICTKIIAYIDEKYNRLESLIKAQSKAQVCLIYYNYY